MRPVFAIMGLAWLIAAAAPVPAPATAPAPATVAPPSGALTLVFLGRGSEGDAILTETSSARPGGATGLAWILTLYAADRDVRGKPASGDWNQFRIDCAAHTAQVVQGASAVSPDGAGEVTKAMTGPIVPTAPGSASEVLRAMVCDATPPPAARPRYNSVSAAITGTRASKP